LYENKREFYLVFYSRFGELRPQKIKENISGVYSRFGELRPQKIKENISTVLATGRIGSRIEFKSGNSSFGELRPHKRKENIICMYRNL
jgi:hypothetical protein